MQAKPLGLGMGLVLLAVWLTGAPCRAEPFDLMLGQVWEAPNQERAKMGLPPLHLNRLLMAAARAHVQDMATRRTLTHAGEDGSTAAQRIERQGYHYVQLNQTTEGSYTSSLAVESFPFGLSVAERSRRPANP